jgi:hypothetical protein
MASKVSLPMYAEEVQKDMLDRLNRIEGQVRGLGRMVENQRPCLEVLHQRASGIKRPHQNRLAELSGTVCHRRHPLGGHRRLRRLDGSHL